MKISSIVIARNEGKNIERCLKSQTNCVDEMVVLVDDSSTDNTYDIVKTFPHEVKVKYVKWQGYSKTKQYAISLTSNNWILWIDADEAITGELSKEICSLKQGSTSNTSEFSAYSIPRIANFLGKWIRHSGWYPGRVVRLFDKMKAKFSENDVHEHLIVDGMIGELKGDIEHYTDPTINHYFEKFNKYTTLAAEELIRKGKEFTIADILIRPGSIFLKMYILKQGFLDGLQGFILAVFSSAYVFTKYCKFWELKKIGVKNNGSK